MAKWSPELRASVRLQGGDEATPAEQAEDGPFDELVRDLYNFQGGSHFAVRLENLCAALAARQAPTDALKEPSPMDNLRKNDPAFAAHLDRCSAEVATWPKWKQMGYAEVAARPAPDSRDAARYRWLLERFIGYDFYWGGKPDAETAADRGKVVAVIEVGETFKGGRDFSSAIDAAQEKAQ